MRGHIVLAAGSLNVDRELRDEIARDITDHTYPEIDVRWIGTFSPATLIRVHDIWHTVPEKHHNMIRSRVDVWKSRLYAQRQGTTQLLGFEFGSYGTGTGKSKTAEGISEFFTSKVQEVEQQGGTIISMSMEDIQPKYSYLTMFLLVR